MNRVNSTNYYRYRENHERETAAKAADPRIAAIHLELAERYSRLVGEAANRDKPSVVIDFLRRPAS